jgi:hypothetical protein
MQAWPSNNANDQQCNNNTINASFWMNALNDLGLWASHHVQNGCHFQWQQSNCCGWLSFAAVYNQCKFSDERLTIVDF